MKVTVQIENTYADEQVVNEETVDVPVPLLNDADMEEWWEDYFFPLTGTGEHRSNDDAIYEVKILACDELPQLIGETYEWG